MAHKSVTLLNVEPLCSPFGDTEFRIHEEVAIVTLASADGEVEQPFSINLEDSRNLTLEMMRVLACHDDFRMRQILIDFFGEDDADFG